MAAAEIESGCIGAAAAQEGRGGTWHRGGTLQGREMWGGEGGTRSAAVGEEDGEVGGE